MGKKSLQDRVAVVTGGASGIGYAIARTIIDEGARVAIVDISGERAHSASERLGASGAQLIVIAADIADESQVEAMFDEVVERFGRVDVLVHSAGIGVERTIFDTSLEEWNRVIRVNLTGSFLCARGAARRMAPKGFGRIVFLSSAAGLRGGTGRTALWGVQRWHHRHDKNSCRRTCQVRYYRQCARAGGRLRPSLSPACMIRQRETPISPAYPQTGTGPLKRLLRPPCFSQQIKPAT